MLIKTVSAALLGIVFALALMYFLPPPLSLVVSFHIDPPAIETQEVRSTPGDVSTKGSQTRDTSTAEAKETPRSDMQTWMPAILALFGSLLVVLMGMWLNTKALSAQIDALRAEMKQSMAEFRVDIVPPMADLRHRVEVLEQQRGGLYRP